MCVALVFAIPLHAARGAMAADCRCPREPQPIFPPLQKTRSCPQRHVALYRGNLSPFSHIRLTKEKGKLHDLPKTSKTKQPPSLYSSIPSRRDSATSSDPGTPYPSPLAAGTAFSGASAGFSAPYSLRWGGGVLHPYTGSGRCCGLDSTSTSAVG